MEHNIEMYRKRRGCENAERLKVAPDEVLMAAIS